VFPDAPQLFVSDGVHVDLVRGGEPRLRAGRRMRKAAAAVVPAPARRRQPLLTRASRPAVS
jgi:hypothetical protein